MSKQMPADECNPSKTTPMPVPHMPTHNQSTGIRVVKYGVSAALIITKCIINGGVQCKFVV